MAENEEEKVKLLGVVGSPFVYRVQLALKLKGVQYELLEENLEHKSQLLLKYNPIHKKVPVLVHDENPITESLVILEYIEETWKGNPILPQEPYSRALARFWTKFIDEKCMSTIWKTATTLDEKEREKAIEESHEVLQILENELKDKFFGGETLGLVDIVGTCVAFWLPAIEQIVGLELLTSEKFPKLYNWTHQVLNHPFVKETLPPREPFLAAFKARIQILTPSK
ncbi:probable glutathione S-transferase [Cajanus cajan]|uniref:glutathione transferase n=1 Tax=Cajanus cajan TaxID=3821 RepID=A0A151SMB1_CAJCA|nr:probable glutathione S-transferase [Cajanus cajan]KYP55974.1 putative glutathione S-transferase [Cajanus cajan]